MNEEPGGKDLSVLYLRNRPINPEPSRFRVKGLWFKV